MVTPINSSTTVAAAGALTGTYDAAALTGDFTLDLTCTGLAAGKKLRVAIEDSALGTFADAVTLALYHFIGPIDPAAPVSFSWRKYQLTSATVGAANNKLRVNTLEADTAPAGVVQGSVIT